MNYPYFPNGYFPYQAGDYPAIGNVLDIDTVGGVPGTYHAPDISVVKYGTLFGALSSLVGIYGQSAVGEENEIIGNLLKAINERFRTVPNDLYTNIGGRLFLDEADTGADYPYIVFFVVTNNDDNVFAKKGGETLIQFSIFSASSSAVEITGLHNDLRVLFDDCFLMITSNDLVWMKRAGLQTMIEDITTPSGTQTVKHYVQDYEITTQ
jgi:hypothetical protein